jgi:hypothetical protein
MGSEHRIVKMTKVFVRVREKERRERGGGCLVLGWNRG